MGIPDWGHLEPIKRDGNIVAAKLRGYAGEPQEYMTFISPEAYRKLEQYVQQRASQGEKITKQSPLVETRN
jgi:hypothetical protein